ncbi:helix-turn-helix domain-containing protein [Rossellomorea marisflavi]|uniref:helix-turn-helix domain-containing protein n=1 Tax=Rossellomorea marisflavi TaxID=189381 RepID=UPI00345C78F7
MGNKTLRIEQHWVDPNSPTRLDAQELYVLGHMLDHVSYHGTFITSLEVLGALIPILKKKRQNETKIWESLLTLQEQGIIVINEVNNKVFELEFNLDRSKSYDIIPMEFLHYATVEEFPLYCYIYRHQKYNGSCRLSFSKIETLTGKSNRTAQRLIDRCEAIEKESGAYIERDKQEMNQYRLIPSYFKLKTLDGSIEQCGEHSETHSPQDQSQDEFDPSNKVVSFRQKEKEPLLRIDRVK